jgi:hypothetical protein
LLLLAAQLVLAAVVVAVEVVDSFECGHCTQSIQVGSHLTLSPHNLVASDVVTSHTVTYIMCFSKQN